MAGLRTEFPFVLPKGWVDAKGNLHRQGRMRLATARDELEALGHAEVAGNVEDPRLALVVLSRVIVQLGDREKVAPRDLDSLFAADLAHLQDVYAAINYGTQDDIDRVIGGAVQTAPLTTIDAVAASMAPPPPPPQPAVLHAVPPADVPRAARPGAQPEPTVLLPAPAAQVADEPAAEADEPELDDEPRPVLKGRRARIEEVGRSSRPRNSGAR